MLVVRARGRGFFGPGRESALNLVDLGRIVHEDRARARVADNISQVFSRRIGAAGNVHRADQLDRQIGDGPLWRNVGDQTDGFLAFHSQFDERRRESANLLRQLAIVHLIKDFAAPFAPAHRQPIGVYVETIFESESERTKCFGLRGPRRARLSWIPLVTGPGK